MTETKKTGGGIIVTLSIGKGSGGIPVDEFCKLVDVVTERHGKDVMVSVEDENGHMHLSKPEIGEITGYRYSHHLGYIDLKTGSLVWDGAA